MLDKLYLSFQLCFAVPSFMSPFSRWQLRECKTSVEVIIQCVRSEDFSIVGLTQDCIICIPVGAGMKIGMITMELWILYHSGILASLLNIQIVNWELSSRMVKCCNLEFGKFQLTRSQNIMHSLDSASFKLLKETLLIYMYLILFFPLFTK